jgi:MoaA/NifB/PqqE/SkfB family radical SAM enzyme
MTKELAQILVDTKFDFVAMGLHTIHLEIHDSTRGWGNYA